ncbi:hypothetical protein [Hymenobacter guriensis]|uniref:Uncharacterized protein n=1 Tax=Hymenobacter guriensis TaxID=2793065 RepID=A0ABS0L7F0_9BACT|nr:hypothetical protein [Hymenobacter guriensis]MBG8556066.1 hypothetical protein [Hymenobacter guriensis]
MNRPPQSYPSTTGLPAQEAYLVIEQKPRDKAERIRLAKLRQYVQHHTHQADLRDLAPAVRELMGPGYQIGCGSSHIWILPLAGDDMPATPERLAIVADRLTTTLQDWNGPRVSTRPQKDTAA